MISIKELCCLVFVVCFTWFGYRTAFNCEFVFDDHLAIERNNDVVGSGGWLDLLKHDFWGKPLALADSNKSFRPVVVASFKLNYILSPTPYAFHAVNVALHCFVSFLVCMVSKAHNNNNDAWRPMLIAGSFFGVHPVHAEAVTGIVGRADIMCAMFALLGYLCLLKRVPSLLQCAMYYLLCMLSVLSKETGIMLVCITLVSDVLLHLRFPGLRKVVTNVAVVLSYWYLRMVFVGQVDLNGSLLLRKTENPILFAPTLLSKVLSTLYIQSRYALLLVYPKEMCCEYPFDCLPLLHDLNDPRCYTILVTAVVIALVLAVAIQQRSRVALIFISWIVFPHLPASGIFFTIGTMLAERLLYLPSVGLTLLVGHVFRAEKKFRDSMNFNILLMSYCITFHGKLAERNREWRTDETLFKSALRVCPNAAKHHQQYGLLLLNKHEVADASMHLNRAHEIDPEWCEPPLYLGKIAAHKKEYDTALWWWRKCVGCPYLGDQCFNLYYEVQGSLYSGNTSAEHELGNVLIDVKQFSSAVTAFRQAGLKRYNNQNWEGAVESFTAAVSAWRRLGHPLVTEKKEDEEMNHPCNIWYWLGMSYSKLTMQLSALRVYREMFISCALMPKAVMAAAEGLSAIYQEAMQSDVVRGRLDMTEVDVYEAHTDTLIAISENKEITGLSEKARDTYLTTASRLLLKVSEVRETCSKIKRAVDLLSKRKDASDRLMCEALHKHRSQCGGTESLKECEVFRKNEKRIKRGA